MGLSGKGLLFDSAEPSSKRHAARAPLRAMCRRQASCWHRWLRATDAAQMRGRRTSSWTST